MATDDIQDAVADMGMDERFAFARGLIRSYALANEVLTVEALAGADVATIAAARQRLTSQWDNGPGVFIDSLTGGVRK